jgi:hypothetical protein
MPLEFGDAARLVSTIAAALMMTTTAQRPMRLFLPMVSLFPDEVQQMKQKQQQSAVLFGQSAAISRSSSSMRPF